MYVSAREVTSEKDIVQEFPVIARRLSKVVAAP
jgi:hypothetical protein